uniref:Uncharacterized protein n=1 Tax=Rhizophora mucronata TaxID=61149 RepID=A0A2P2NUH8_RHIMU
MHTFFFCGISLKLLDNIHHGISF